jgi:hypothetical protein
MDMGSGQGIMPSNMPPFVTRPFPRSRRLVIDACREGQKRHTIHILCEYDATLVKQRMREYAERTGVRLSLPAYLTACIGRTVASDTRWHAYRKGRRLVMFDEVDIGTLIDHEVEGERLATLHVIRNTQSRSVREIHDEYRRVARGPVRDMPGVNRLRGYLNLPGFLRRLFYRWIEFRPDERKRLCGTILFTAPGVFARSAGWGMPINACTLTITLGGSELKPGVVDGRVEPREFVNLTISFDHDVVDGGPATRFAASLKQVFEEAELIAKPEGESEPGLTVIPAQAAAE